ncbi:hypothetical protein TPHA_0B02730 [Tetrapisispora phaffii CBS 4417]|uniref:Small ribosomal subunit protein bS18m n=1 Tax=Tetrapisispora phaffii (strain ATCC 24235 / CBS 4417 / NBRC 1672 / NRRL Y-8282 / UCD 70-5) TaxID=1071381 RepID=G8BPL4_TETPH|nr:mitochondrial 37S ribosomal protein RSM18 TPHA_0B02730 [Tetrapisispora phaffii CBS 4417]CCE61945.1 hypothetical protein TPHA_0B02730 [Tetrapisispora phaffii CBS 4417]
MCRNRMSKNIISTLNPVRTFSSNNMLRLPFKINLKPIEKSSIDITPINNTIGNAEPRKNIDSKLTKKFQTGAIYDPFDFSLSKIYLDKKNSSKKNSINDYFDVYDINPLDLYTSPDVLSKFLSSTGKILHRDVTGLSAKNQRRLSKAVRRCQAFGLISKTHRDISMLPSISSGKL